MTISTLLSDLKSRKFKPVYLLHGEESYYIDLISGYIEGNLLKDEEKSFNQTTLYGRDTDITTVLNSAKRFPMMSDFQLIIVKEAQNLKWSKEDDRKGDDPLISYLEAPLSSTVLVFCYKHAKFDKRKRIYKLIEKNGVVFESATFYDNKVPQWIEGFVRDKAYRINPEASALIAEHLGNDLSKIAGEIEKLILNLEKGSEITRDHIYKNIGISKEYNVFELQNALARQNVVKANRIVNYFAANPKTNPIQMTLGVLSTWFTKLYKYHYIKGGEAKDIASELGVSPFFVKDFELAARAFTPEKVFNVVSLLREYDLKSKGVDATANTSHGELLRELVFKIMH